MSNRPGLLLMGLSVAALLLITGCDSDDSDFVTLRGQALASVPESSIANAECAFVDFENPIRQRAVADPNGVFELMLFPNAQGLLGCHPPGLTNLTLLTFISAKDALPGTMLPAQGVEEVSPRTTVIANIIVQTEPPDPQQRKAELLNDLVTQEPDITALSGAATALFERMLQTPVTNVPFAVDSGITGEEAGQEGGASDGGGASGDAGDGAEFSPLLDVQCEFALDLAGDSALEDLWRDGALDRPDLQSIAPDVAPDAAIQGAFARLFPQGMQPTVDGQPLRIRTDAQGTYFLPIPPLTPGFVQCAPKPSLALSTFVRARQALETLVGQDVSPSSHLLTSFVLPQVTPEQRSAIQDNFLVDIGALQSSVAGQVSVESQLTSEGPVMADIDGDGTACSFLDGPEAAAITYDPAGGAVFVATTLYKALLLEARTAADASYTTLLDVLLNRTTDAGDPRIEAFGSDLVLGGVPETRAPILSTLWNTCVQFSIEQALGLPLAQVVRSGQLRVAVVDEAGQPLPKARVSVEGGFVVAESSCDNLVDSLDNGLVCQADDSGQVLFTLFGEQALMATSVVLTAASMDNTMLGQVEAAVIPPVTVDAMVTATPR